MLQYLSEPYRFAQRFSCSHQYTMKDVKESTREYFAYTVLYSDVSHRQMLAFAQAQSDIVFPPEACIWSVSTPEVYCNNVNTLSHGWSSTQNHHCSAQKSHERRFAVSTLCSVISAMLIAIIAASNTASYNHLFLSN